MARKGKWHQGRRSQGGDVGNRPSQFFDRGDEYPINSPFFHMFNQILLFHNVKT